MTAHRWLTQQENAATARGITTFCEANKISHREFARRNGMAPSQLSEYLSNTKRMPIHCYMAVCKDMKIAPWLHCDAMIWMKELAHAA